MAAQSDPNGVPVGQSAPGTKQFTITPNNDADLAVTARSILVNDTGPVNVAFIAFNDTDSKIWKGLVAGDIIPMFVKRVLVTGTTATDLLGLV
jgi:hypothetical protein